MKRQEPERADDDVAEHKQPDNQQHLQPATAVRSQPNPRGQHHGQRQAQQRVHHQPHQTLGVVAHFAARDPTPCRPQPSRGPAAGPLGFRRGSRSVPRAEPAAVVPKSLRSCGRCKRAERLGPQRRCRVCCWSGTVADGRDFVRRQNLRVIQRARLLPGCGVGRLAVANHLRVIGLVREWNRASLLRRVVPVDVIGQRGVEQVAVSCLHSAVFHAQVSSPARGFFCITNGVFSTVLSQARLNAGSLALCQLSSVGLARLILAEVFLD